MLTYLVHAIVISFGLRLGVAFQCEAGGVTVNAASLGGDQPQWRIKPNIPSRCNSGPASHST